MAATGSMRDVARARSPRKNEGKMTTREAVADVARHIMAYRNMRNKDVIENGPALRSTQFYEIMKGNEVSDTKLSVLAGILSTPDSPLPVNTFRLMVAGDIKAIERLEMADHLKQYILDVLAGAELPKGRRATDS